MNETVEPQDKYFADGDLRLHYLDWGNPGAPPLLLLHHHCGNAHYWDFLAPELREQYHIIAVDNRGHGGSSRGGDYGPPSFAADLMKLTDSLGFDKVSLLGHSLGGIVAILYALARPEKVAKLVVVDMGPEMNADGVKRMMQRMATLPSYFETEEEYVRLMGPVEPKYRQDFLKHLAKYVLKRDDNGKLVQNYDPDLRKSRVGVPPFTWADLPKITCPALLVHGAASELLLPATAVAMAEMLPQGKLVDIAGGSHNLPGEYPEEFAAAVKEFLWA